MVAEEDVHPVDCFIGDQIKQARKKRELSQDDLADLLGISRQVLQRYEQGTTKIAITRLYDLAGILNFSVPELLKEAESIVSTSDINKNAIVSVNKARPINILLVEDNSADALIAKDAIEACSYNTNIVVAQNGVDAIDMVYKPRKVSPDIILLDLNLPKKDGFDVLTYLKRDSSTRHIPVIVLTNSINMEEMNRSYQLGASGYITKSFDFKEFCFRLEIIIGYWYVNILPGQWNAA